MGQHVIELDFHDFRGVTAAASLKLEIAVVSDVYLQPDFRGVTAAASLKLRRDDTSGEVVTVISAA